MSFWKRLFARHEPPGPGEVVSHAMQCVTAVAPRAELEARDDAVVVRMAGLELLWTLTDVIRLAADDRSWREGLASMANDVVHQLRSETSTDGVPMRRSNVVVIVWRQAKLDALGFEIVSEELVADLALVYGVRAEGRVRLVRPYELEASKLDMRELRKRAIKNMAVSTSQLGLDFLSEGLPVLTNHVGHPYAASLLADTTEWKRLSKRLGPTLVGVPAPSRLFIGPDDERMRALFTELVARSYEVEEETLTRDLLRFAEDGWSVAAHA